ncbi:MULTISPECIES: twin-arginine translocase TatA/TatE family subunit [Novosphingobium]|jgi:sec-independent protein translocase protein TatA|uniref:Sec-independent protein translocase protein TatA n=1 Tax=Novosphingobium panipatense TaxID=428991 RepID=A0ABY1Q9R2_9SPHN|nr:MULTISPECIES: twin-arginine translocase TatA/TatE family subunit [Novosphingobium]SMP61172.1 sec-independent protein translocase protein TatA [Novosphingobium panipatense]
MGSFSIWHWLIVLVIVLVLFGRGRVSEIMGDFGKGIKSFKDGMNEEEARKASPTPPAAQIGTQKADPAPDAAATPVENRNEQV